MKRIENFSDYGITSCGRIWSFKTNKFLALCTDRNGYKFAQLYDNNGKKRIILVHRAVALAYLPNPENLRTVDHIDNNKEHNYVGNLQWMTDKDNITKEQGKKIHCVELNLDFPSQKAAAEYFGCCHQNISNCLRGRAKTACGYHWEVIK